MGASFALPRRGLLKALSLPLWLAAMMMPVGASNAANAGEDAETARGGKRVLVAYFSRSGNTRVIAGQIQRALEADLFEIEPAKPYPDDYNATVEQARQERDSGYEPPLKAEVKDLGAFDTVYLGFPIWGETTPPVIRSFLTAHDLSGKTVIPFITHGGYGPGNSMAVLNQKAPRARIQKPLVMEADQEKRTLTQVTGWLQSIERANKQ